MNNVLGISGNMTALEVVFRLVLSLGVGAIIGLDRSKRGSPAGLKTHALVCIGSCLVMLVAEAIFQKYGSGDVARMPAQVISGIGFLGAGTILVTSRNQIRGLTSAASIWFVACLGLAVGFGFYLGTVIATLMEVFIVRILSHRFQNSQDRDLYDIYLEYDESLDVMGIMKKVKQVDCKIMNVEKEKMELFQMQKQKKYAIFVIEIPEDKTIDEILKEVEKVPGVTRVAEI